jgi:phosphohistidine phosphatase
MKGRRIYLVRHAIAEDFARSGRDEDRLLSSEGRETMEQAARGLAKLKVRPALVLSSPLVRARETAEIVARHLKKVDLELSEELAPGVSHAGVTRLVADRMDGANVMLVGHEPDLGELLSYWLTGSVDGLHTDFGKGSVACISAQDSLGRGMAVLEWMMRCGQLGAIEAD